VMVMEYLTQVIGVLITLTQDALKKVVVVQQQQISRRLFLPLIGLGTKQDRNRERYEDIL